MTDLNILMDPLDEALFPGVHSNVQVHDGFRNEHALTAPIILSEVKKLFLSKHTTNVTVVCPSYFNVHTSFYEVSFIGWTFARRRIGRTRCFILDPQPSDKQFSKSSDLRHTASWKWSFCEAR